MKEVLEEIHRIANRLAPHPLLAWIGGDDVALEDRFIFAPVYVNFIMAFSDLNKWFLRYPEPRDERERAINRHTFEDETHAMLFLEDWRKLGFDGQLGWDAGRTIGWYYAAPETEIFRAHGMEIMELLSLNEDPFMRYAAMTAIEACGHMFSTATSKTAVELEARTGQEYRYFGVYHLNKETGHVHSGGGVFDANLLDEQRRAKALRLAARIVDIFEEQFTCALEYAEGALRRRRGAEPPERAERPGIERWLEHPGPQRETNPGERTARSAEVRRVLEERKSASARHGFFQWMRDPQDGLSAQKKLQRFVALWAPDAMGYKDLNRYALRYRNPEDGRQRAINRWVAALESHQQLFMRDWVNLGMDRILGWKASETLKFYCLSKHTELPRRNMASFVKLAYAEPDPVLRFWLMTALEASGDAFFDTTRALAERAEQETGMPLDYLANRHPIAHPALPRDDEADAALLELGLDHEGLSPSGRDAAIAMINTVFDGIEGQYSLSLDLSVKNIFKIA